MEIVISARCSKIQYTRTSVPIFPKLAALSTVKRVIVASTATDDAFPFQNSETAFVAYSYFLLGINERVAHRTLAIALSAYSPYCYSWLLSTEYQVGVVLCRHFPEFYTSKNNTIIEPKQSKLLEPTK